MPCWIDYTFKEHILQYLFYGKITYIQKVKENIDTQLNDKLRSFWPMDNILKAGNIIWKHPVIVGPHLL